MPVKVFISAIIHAPVEKVWGGIRDFRPLWHPDVADCHIENDEDCAKVGCIRNFNLKDGVNIREKLLTLSDVDHTYAYSIETAPMPVRNFVAALKLLPVTEGDKTYAQWTAEFDCTADAVQSEIEQHVGSVFQRGFDTLNNMFCK